MDAQNVSKVIDAMSLRGFKVEEADVEEFAKYGSGPESTVSADYDGARDDAMLEVFDALGLEVGT